jgi:exodeoxyribonuclease III
MKLLTWNIRCGGSSATQITNSLLHHRAEIIVLTEFRLSATGRQLCLSLAENGWQYQASSNPPHSSNGVLVAASIPLMACAHDIKGPVKTERWLEVQFAEFRLVAVYVRPITGGKGVEARNQKKQDFFRFWDSLLNMAGERVDSPLILMGDFNTGKHYIDEQRATFYGSNYIDEIESLGFVDAWRYLHGNEREYTWFSYKGNGFRLDYAFLSPKLKDRLLDAYHSHVEREKRISDHSVLILSLKD